MKRQVRRVNKRDREILEFVARYRIGTVPLFTGQFFQSQTNPGNVNRVLLRLQRWGLLRRVIAARGYFYFILTRQALALLGEEPRSLRPLTEQTLPVSLAVATYCVENGIRRLTSAEFQKHFSNMWRPGMRSSNYVLVNLEGKLRLEMLLVDRGGAAHRINARVRRVIAQRKGLPKFHTLMKSGRFRITVLTGTVQQEDKIRRRLSRRPFAPIEITTYVIPELAELLMLRR